MIVPLSSSRWFGDLGDGGSYRAYVKRASISSNVLLTASTSYKLGLSAAYPPSIASCLSFHFHRVGDLGTGIVCSVGRVLLLGTRLKRCGRGDFWISLRFVRVVVDRGIPVKDLVAVS